MTKKKDFKTATSLFLTPAPEAAASDIPTGYRIVRESKTERLQLLIRPSTHQAIQRIAADQGISKNELINQLLENFIQGVK